MINHVKNFAIGTLCAASFMAMIALVAIGSWLASGLVIDEGLSRFILAVAIFIAVVFGLAYAGDENEKREQSQ